MKTLCKISVLALLIALVVPLAATKLNAAERHPHYLRALSDLRFSRALLQRPNGGAMGAEERMAIAKIDDAIAELKRASIDDGKNLEDHPPVDAHWPWRGRLHKAAEALERAKGDCAKEEDNPAARGLKDRAIAHIEEAHHHVEDAIRVAER